LRDLALTGDFSITTGSGYSGVLNPRPKAGEQTLYSEPLYSPMKDYAILAYLPGQQSGRHMLVLSGLTTMGTQAAVDLACNRDAFEQLLRQAAPSGTVRPFEAVIETTIRAAFLCRRDWWRLIRTNPGGNSTEWCQSTALALSTSRSWTRPVSDRGLGITVRAKTGAPAQLSFDIPAMPALGMVG
jgi:hypothetical protein